MGTFWGKTKIKKNKKSPEWNETFEVPETISAEGLVLEVYDWNAIAKDKFLGLVKLTSLGAYHGRENVEFELQPREGGGSEKFQQARSRAIVPFICIAERQLKERGKGRGGYQWTMLQEQWTMSLRGGRASL